MNLDRSIHGCRRFAVTAACLALIHAPAHGRDAWQLSPAEFAARPEAHSVVTVDTFDATRFGLAVFHETNRYRLQLGLPPFLHLAALDRAADIQATTNALNQDASHHNLIPNVATPFERVRRVGLSPGIVAENAALIPLLDLDVAHGFVERDLPTGRVLLDGATLREVRPHTYASLAARVVTAWIASPSHLANLISPQLRYLGCSGRTTRTIDGLDMVACIQEFYTPRERR